MNLPMKLGYNTNGLACHRWDQGFELLSEAGFRAVAITLDHNCLDPFSPRLKDELAAVRELLVRLQLRAVVETGARFLLNPRIKHEPTLMSPRPEDRSIRIDFLCRAIDIAVELGAEAVSFWSGILHEPVEAAVAMRRLAEGCREVLAYARDRRMPLAFEPEPGMFIDTFAQFRRLTDLIDDPLFGLTIDIGHVHCIEEGAISAHLQEWQARLRNVHIEDMCRGVHEHLRFGAGEIDFPPVWRTLEAIGYSGCVNVELSRHSHMAPEAVRESFEFLQQLRSNGSSFK